MSDWPPRGKRFKGILSIVRFQRDHSFAPWGQYLSAHVANFIPPLSAVEASEHAAALYGHRPGVAAPLTASVPGGLGPWALVAPSPP